MITIQQIHKENHPQGKNVHYKYTSDQYYEVKVEKIGNGWCFSMQEERFSVPFVKELEEDIFQPHKEGSEFYIALFEGREAAVMVIQEMEWNHTLLIHDLYVKSSFKRLGIGQSLIQFAKQRAITLGVRSIILETQTSNYPAIQFYIRNGFEPVGLNTISYSNTDIQNREVRIEMGYVLKECDIE